MIPVLLKDITPSASLKGYVRTYQIFRFLFDKEIVPPAKFHVPRPEHSITFYIRDAQKFSCLNSTTILAYPQCVINGVYTAPIYRYGGNDFLAIKIVLQPSILYHLVKFPLEGLTNKFMDAEGFWGNEIRSTCEQLNELNDIDKMIIVIEKFVENQFKKITNDFHPIDKVCQLMLCYEDTISSDWLAKQSFLSVRQFIRKFEERMGISPKMFSRLIRFNRTIRMKNNSPTLDWLYIALACGYYDYQHLVIDFKEFTEHTPPSFFEQELKAPERTFGLHEF